MIIFFFIIVSVFVIIVNLGFGFDCFGVVIFLYNCFKFFIVDSVIEVKIIVIGKEVLKVSIDRNNFVY